MTNAREQSLGVALNERNRIGLEQIAALLGKSPAELAAEMVAAAIKAFEDTGALDPPVNPLIYQIPSETVHEVGEAIGVLMTVDLDLMNGDDSKCAWLKLMVLCQDALRHAERQMETADAAARLSHDRVMGLG